VAAEGMEQVELWGRRLGPLSVSAPAALSWAFSFGRRSRDCCFILAGVLCFDFCEAFDGLVCQVCNLRTWQPPLGVLVSMIATMLRLWIQEPCNLGSL
jgi:hypothetical protein